MKTNVLRGAALLFGSLLLAACVSPPLGPSVLVLPGSASSFERFQHDDDGCREFASVRIGERPADAQARAAVAEAAVATAVGAAAGAAIGAAAGDAGEGAAIGAGSGLLLGSAGGVARGDGLAGDLQHRYDNAYVQCMYAKGHQVPVPRSLARARGDRSRGLDRRRTRPAPPPAWEPPPPPRGAPPPPPPDAS